MNPFDKIKEPTKPERYEPPNPGFYCSNFVQHHGHVMGRGHRCPTICKRQCTPCEQSVALHHWRKYGKKRLEELKNGEASQ